MCFVKQSQAKLGSSYLHFYESVFLLNGNKKWIWHDRSWIQVTPPPRWFCTKDWCLQCCACKSVLVSWWLAVDCGGTLGYRGCPLSSYAIMLRVGPLVLCYWTQLQHAPIKFGWFIKLYNINVKVLYKQANMGFAAEAGFFLGGERGVLPKIKGVTLHLRATDFWEKNPP